MSIVKATCWIIIIVCGVIIAIYLMQYLPQTKPIYDKAVTLAGQAKDYVMGNIPTVAGASGIVTAIGGGAISTVNKAKNKAKEVQSAAQEQIGGLMEEKEKLTASAQDAINQAKEMQGQVSVYKAEAENAKTMLQSKEQEITRLKSQLDGQVRMLQGETKERMTEMAAEAKKLVENIG